MDRDHYLPAAYMGRFSSHTKGVRRDRPIYVIHRGDCEAARITTSDTIGWLPDLYTLGEGFEDPRQIDESWTEYEQRLMDALDALERAGGADMDAKLWLRVLVPFVAGLFVRGPDFGPRHDARLPPLENLDQNDNNNQVRLVEQARLLAPLMAAVWTVFTFPGLTDLVTSDRGYGYVFHEDFGRSFAIPINPRQALVLLPNRQRVVLEARNGNWRAPIDKWEPPDKTAQELNRSIASNALTTLIGPTADSVEVLAAEFVGEADLLTEPFNSDWASSRVRRMHEWDWLRALHVIGAKPADNEPVPDQLYEMDADRFAKGWMPRLLLGIRNPDGMARGLTRDGDRVGLALVEEGDLDPWPPPPRTSPDPKGRSKGKRARASTRASRRSNRRRKRQ